MHCTPLHLFENVSYFADIHYYIYIKHLNSILYIGYLKIADLQAHNVSCCELEDLPFSNILVLLPLYFNITKRIIYDTLIN